MTADSLTVPACRLFSRLRALLAVGVLALVGAMPALGADLNQLLAYDAAAPLDIRVVKREHRNGAWVEDISFSSASGGPRIKAYLVRPTRVNAPHAGVVFGHWYAYEPNSNRTQFLNEATALARLGVVSVLPDALWSSPAWFPGRSWRDDFRSTVGQAKDFRRAFDVLLAQGGVDPKRIGFVAHDFSAMHAALISAVDTRIKAAVLIAGTARWADWYLYGAADGVPTGDALTAYLAELAQIDPLTTVGLSHARLMFQFGEQDFFTPRDNFISFYRASPPTSRIVTYASDHAMTAPVIRLDRWVWLGEQLGLPSSHHDRLKQWAELEH